MANSFLRRMFGRGGTSEPDDRTDTGPAPTRQQPQGYASYGQAGSYNRGAAAPPVVARGRLAEVSRRRRAADQQLELLERFEARLTEQVHTATEAERNDYARELLSRRLSVRARLEEVTYRRGQLLAEEEKISQELARQEARHPVGPGR